MVEKRKLSIFEKNLTLWVLLCIGAGIVLGKIAPEMAVQLDSLSMYQVSIPISICLFLMMYPIMVKIDFGQIVKAAKTPKPVALTLLFNWAIKPFTMFLFASLFLGHLLRAFFARNRDYQDRSGSRVMAELHFWHHLIRSGALYSHGVDVELFGKGQCGSCFGDVCHQLLDDAGALCPTGRVSAWHQRDAHSVANDIAFGGHLRGFAPDHWVPFAKVDHKIKRCRLV
jgi:hypothetical protein